MGKIELCNRALAEIKRGAIQTLVEASPQAAKCALYYPVVLRELLHGTDWSFARVTVDLAEHAQEPSADWGYRYALPNDPVLVVPRCVLTTNYPRTGPPIEYEIETLTDLSGKSLLADVSPAQLTYTYLCDDPSLYDPLFETAFVKRLASDLAKALNTDDRMQIQLLQEYRFWLGEARVADSAARHIERPEPGGIAARA